MNWQCWTAASASCSFVVCARFFRDKYDITQHPNYKYTVRCRPKNAFDIEKFL